MNSYIQKIERLVLASPAYSNTRLTKTLYHGSSKPIKDFHLNGKGRFGEGLYLTPSLDYAKFYAEGGRQGASGQKLKTGSGHVYEFKVSGPCLKIIDLEQTMQDVVGEDDDAEEKFQSHGDMLAGDVTKFLAAWAKEYHGAKMLWIAEDGSVLSPIEQVLILDKSVIKSWKNIK